MKRRRTAKEKNADEEGTDSAAAANRFSTFINEEKSKRARTNWSMFAKKIRKALSHTADPLHCALGFFEITKNDISSTRESYLLRGRDICDFSLEIPIYFDRMSSSSLKGFDNTGNARIWPGGKTVMELGAGLLGLPGISSSFGAKTVVVTDGNTNSVKSLSNIILHNKLPNVSSVSLLFGEDFGEEFEVILLADCVFFEENHCSLIESFDKLLSEDGCVLLCSPSHDRFTYSPNLAFDSFITSHLKHLIDEPDLVLPHLYEIKREVIKAVHSSVINTSEDLKKEIQISHSKDIQFSKDVLSKISGLIFDIVTTHWTSDLLAFSKHGSRQNCNNDDVLLLARRNEALLATLMSESVGSVHNSPKGKQKTSKESEDITVLPTPSSTPFLPPERRVSAISSDLDMDIELGLKTPSALPSHSGGVTPLAASTPYKGGSLKKSGPGLSCITPIASKVNKRAAVLSYIAECEEMIEETTPLPPDVLPVIERTESSFTRNNLSPSPSQISSFERILEHQQEQPQSPQNADDSFDVFQETPHKSAPQSKAEDSFEDDDFVQNTGSCQNKTAPRRNLLSASTMVPKSQKPLSTPVGDVEDPWQNNFAQFSFETLDMKEKPKTQHVNKQASKTSSPFSFSQDSFDAESSKRVFSTTTSNKKNEPPNKTRRSNIPISDLMNSFIDDDTDFIGLDSLI